MTLALLVSATGCGYVLQPGDYRDVQAPDAPLQDAQPLDAATDAATDAGPPPDPDPDGGDAVCNSETMRLAHPSLLLEGTGLGLEGPSRGTIVLLASTQPQQAQFHTQPPLQVLNQGSHGEGRVHWVELAVPITPRASGVSVERLRSGLGCDVELRVQWLPELTETSTAIASLYSEVDLQGPLGFAPQEALVIKAVGPLRIGANGALDVSANGQQPGAGGFAGGDPSMPGLGPRPGAPASSRTPAGNGGASTINWLWPLAEAGGSGGGGGRETAGGGGGGIIRLSASEIHVAGRIAVAGGDGESSTSTACNAAGAGGGGGSIWMQSELLMLDPGFELDVSGGQARPSCGLSGEAGRLRIDAKSSSPLPAGAEQGPSLDGALARRVIPGAIELNYQSGPGPVIVSSGNGRIMTHEVANAGPQRATVRVPLGPRLAELCVGRTTNKEEQHCLQLVVASP